MYIIKKIQAFFKQINLYWAPSDYAPLYSSDDLLKDMSFTNIRREYIFTAILLIAALPILYIDYRNYEAALWLARSGYRYLFYMHLGLLAGTLLFVALIRIRKINSPETVQMHHRILSMGYVVFIMLWCSGISLVDQMIHQEITVYIIGIFAVASAIHLRTRSSVLIFSLSLGLILIGLPYFQEDPHKLKGYYQNITLVSMLAWILSRISYVGYCRDFTNRKIIEKQRMTLERHSKEDYLTGLYNRRYMAILLSQEYARACRYNLHLSVAMADIDFFKCVNDQCSHQVGDEVLKTIASIFMKNLRSFDIVARFGGEEFVIILPETELSEAYTVCERIRVAVEQYPWENVHPGINLTISLGLSDDLSSGNYEKLLSVADERLYRAKNEGRNRVVC